MEKNQDTGWIWHKLCFWRMRGGASPKAEVNGRGKGVDLTEIHSYGVGQKVKKLGR